MKRKLALGLILMAMPVWLQGCTLGYLLRQGVVQVGLLWSRQPLDKVIPTLPDEQQEKLRLMEVARDWAVANLGMKPIKSYQDYIEIKGDGVTNVVQAADSLSLKPYLWTFPIIGAVPYKGFFDMPEAEAEKARLERQGYDTLIRKVAAYSMLGWLPDPLYSPMLRYDAVGLVSTVIHEMTHATLYWQGQADFNESMATYVGSQGAALFFATHEGPDSPRAKEAAGQARDHLKVAAAFDELSAELDRLFATDLPAADKIARKSEIYARAKVRFANLPLETSYHKWLGDTQMNNATLLLNRTYYAGLPKFAALAAQHGDLRETVDWLVKQEAPKDPWAWLDQQVGKGD